MSSSRRGWLLLLALALCASTSSCATVTEAQSGRIASWEPRAQQIRSLPGYAGELGSGHYSGEITVDEARQRRLWYWLAASEGSPTTDPVVLWLTGGPGCSSLDAFIYENGPFRLSFTDEAANAGVDAPPSWRNIEVSDNPHRWTKAATMVFIDSPAGTGMSTSAHKEDYNTNDTRTIADLTTFVEQLLDVFPEYAGNDLYIAGESYAGVYVPLLARSLLKARIGGSGSPVNIKGYLVGNGVADDAYDSNHGVEFAYGHALISKAQLQRLEEACQGNYWNASRGSKCKHLQWDMEDGFGDLNIYAIYHPCTLNGGRVADSGPQGSGLELTKMRRQLGGRRWPLAAGIKRGEEVLNWGHLLKHAIPCADRRQALAWLNAPEVREAIHAPSVDRLPQWAPCSDVVRYTHDAGSMLPVHRHNLKQGLRALIYSGDADYVVPFTGTRAWLQVLGLPETLPWRAWSYGKQVAGFYSRYTEGLTFATVKGAGHMVPQTHPELALELLRWFVSEGSSAGSMLGSSQSV